MKSLFWLLPLSMLSVLSSCVSQQKISWEYGMTEATIQLPEQAKSMVTLNRVRLGYPSSTNGLNSNNPDFMNACFSSFKNQIRKQQFLTVASSQKSFPYTANGEFPDTLTQSQVKSIGMGSDVVAALEMLDQKIRDTYTLEIRRQNLGNNTYKEIDYVIGKREIDVKIGWRLYETSSGKLLDEWEQEQSHSYEAESLERIRATSLLDINFRKEMSRLGSSFGIQYAQHISPTKHLRYRSIYASGNAYLEKGAQLAAREEWEEAEKTWLRGIKNEIKRKKLAYLYHNLAMNEERKGDIIKAREYAKFAANQHPAGVKTQSIVGF